MASTTDEGLLRFRLQMAEQARRFGERLKELREGRGWKQKDVVSAMAEAGDLALNTNQLSRYENGGAYPNEARMQRFAQVFDVDFADLIAPSAPPASRDLMDSLSATQQDAAVTDLRAAALTNEVLAELASVKVALARQRSLLEKLLRNQEAGN